METFYTLHFPKHKVLPIIRGEQTVMTLDWAEPYISMFLDKQIMEENERHLAEGNPSECKSVLRAGIWEILFTDEEQSYQLRVSFDDYGAMRLDKDDIAHLADEYDYHDMDDAWVLYRKLDYFKKPMFFYFHIDKVISVL